MKKHGLSIRYKVLFLLTAIPVITLSIYLVLALKIFENDKIAYVFDSSSNVSGTMASQIKTKLNGVLAANKPVFQDFLTNQKFTNISDVVFDSEASVDSVIALTPDASGKYNLVAKLEKSENLAMQTFLSLQSLIPGYVNELALQNRIVKVPYRDDRFFIFEKIDDANSNRSTIFLIVYRAGDLAESFSAASAQAMYLISQDGTILFGPEGLSGYNISNYFSVAALKNLSKQVSQGAETSKSKDGTELLVSFSKTGFSDLFVVTTVSKEKALSAVQILIRKSLIFFAILISATAIISLFASSSLTSALTSLFAATQKVSKGDFNVQVQVNSSDEVGALASNFNLMAQEVSRLLEQTAEKARMESELQTAKTVQETLFPETEASIGPLEISGYYEPASECGGDWWHYCLVGNKIFLWIGDATGHGAPAALITSAAKSASTIIERLNVSPAKAMELLNRSIYDVSKGRIMMTFFVAAFDLETGEFTYSNASHEAPFLIKKGESALKKKDLIPLNEVNNPRLGQTRDSTYTETTIQLDKDDAIFFYTDGVPDIQNKNKESWGEREFIKNLIAANKDYPAVNDAVSRFVASFKEHRESAPLIDDVTFFMIKYNS